MTTLIEAMSEAARLGAAGFSSTVDDSGNSSTTMLADAALREQSPGPDGYKSAVVFRPNATDTDDRMRVVSEFDEQVGGLVPLIPWTNAPAADEVYHVYSFLPPFDRPGVPMSWKRLVNRALSHIWTVAEFPVGRGGGLNPCQYTLDRAEVTLWAAIAVAGGSGVTVTAPTGWSVRSSATSGTDITLKLYSRRATLDDPINWRFTLDAARAASGLIIAVVDANPTSPIGSIIPTTATTLASASVVTPSITTTANGQLVIRFAAGSSAAAYTVPSNMRQFADVVAELGAATIGLTAFGSYASQAQATGTATATATTAVTASVGITVAVGVGNGNRTATPAGYTVAYNGIDDELLLQRPLDLPVDGWTPNRQHVRKVIRRRYATPDRVRGGAIDIDARKNGRTARIIEDVPNNYLWLSEPAHENEDVILSVQRPYPAALVSDGDTTECPLDVLTARIVIELWQYLNSASQSRGQYSAELAQAIAYFDQQFAGYQVSPAMTI